MTKKEIMTVINQEVDMTLRLRGILTPNARLKRFFSRELTQNVGAEVYITEERDGMEVIADGKFYGLDEFANKYANNTKRVMTEEFRHKNALILGGRTC